jgi:acetyl-CoA carboxylase biotin carboxyl carrier protein
MAGEAALQQAIERDVRALLQAIAGSSVEEIALDRGGVRVLLRRVFETAPASEGFAPTIASAPAPAMTEEPAQPATVEVRAAHVGVFHRARELGGAALAEPGMHVDAGQVVGVVETLGMSAAVEAPAAGVLADLRVEDGQPVEFGQLLAVIAVE